MKQVLAIFCAFAVLMVGLADAQSVVAPNANWTTSSSGGLNSLTRQFTRTLQQGIHATELTQLPVGAEIVGLSFRQYTGASSAWPAANATWKNYEITLAENALPTASWTSTFATNMKNPVLVRKGPMTIPMGAFGVNTPNPNPFDTFYFDFQKSYVYKGGDLVFFITHDGNDQSSACYLEGEATTALKPGRTMYASTYQATTATTTNTTFMVTRIHYGYGPAGCMGKNGSLNLILSNSLVAPTPAPGSINLAVTNGEASAVGMILVSPVKGAAPIPLPGGCNLLIFPSFIGFIPFTLNANGRYDLNLTFPAIPALVGVELQAYASDSSTTAGYVVTNGVSFQAGP